MLGQGETVAGKSKRVGITLMQAMELFGTKEKAEAWFESVRWPDGVGCPMCGSVSIHSRKNRRPTPFHCRDCGKDFSVRTGTLLQGTNLPLHKWALAFYLIATNLKGVSSLKLSRDLGITQKSAWHLLHRIRETWDDEGFIFGGPVQVDETYIGGKGSDKTAVVGLKDEETNHVYAVVVDDVKAETLHQIIHEKTQEDAVIYTDGALVYRNIDRVHDYVMHSLGEYVKGVVTTNSIESFWSMLKRGYIGVYHWMSVKHLHRYVMEFEGRHNQRPLDTIDQLRLMVRGAIDRRLKFKDLISD